MALAVSALFRYPIKSCAGIAVDGAEVAARGLVHDRRWMVVDEAGRFVTQRERPEMSQIRPQLDGDELNVHAPGQPPLRLPTAGPAPGAARRTVEVWASRVEAAIDAAGSAWFAAALGAPLQLVHLPDDVHRPVNPAHARPGDEVGFADGYPFLLVSQGSLDELNRRAPAPLPVTRFRPNIVVDGCAPFAEDGWARLRIGSIGFRGVKPCDRCAVTTVDPATGERGKDPLATLARFRARDGKVWFGMNLIHDGRGTLRVGDPVTVEEFGPTLFPPC
jgi:uncharacterized protein YcbX